MLRQNLTEHDVYSYKIFAFKYLSITYPRKQFLNLQPPTQLTTQFAALKSSTNGQVSLSGNNAYRL